MKKVIILTLAVLSIVGLYTSAQTRNGMVLTDTQAAIDFMYTNGLTKFNTTSTFMADSNLRRDEAAAFFARFARDVLGMVPDTTKAECQAFTDLSAGHKDLQGEMIASCQLGLFKGSNGKFMPTASFSNAHALTVIVRLLDGDQSETGAHWASNYLARAKVLGLTSGLSADSSTKLDTYISRGEVARLIEAGSVQGRTSVDYSQEGETTVDITFYLTNEPLDFDLSNIESYMIGVQYPVEVPNSQTENLIYAALSRLFSVDGFEYGQSGYGNYLYASDIDVTSVTINGSGSYIIELSGTLMGIGVLADPFIKRQIEKTIEHYTNESYEIHLNNTNNRSCVLNPSCG